MEDMNNMNGKDIESPNESTSKLLKNNKPKKSVFSKILLVLLALIAAYLVLVHPIDKLYLRMALSKNISMTITEKINGRDKITVDIDGDYARIVATYLGPNGRNQEVHYYKFEDNKLNEYVKNYETGEWKAKTASALSSNGLSNIFKRSNYKFVFGSLFTWELKDGVYAGELTDVRLQRRIGRYVITGKMNFNGTYQDVVITIGDFSVAKVVPPWEFEIE